MSVQTMAVADHGRLRLFGVKRMNGSNVNALHIRALVYDCLRGRARTAE